MPRTDDDSWDITQSVGATALAVASARAAETESENPLINDPFARVFLDAAGDGVWNWFVDPELPPEIVEAEPDMLRRMQGMRDYMACRTAFFDQFLLQANNAGVRQAVILAAGLDARAWRLPWLGGTTVYELDQPEVLEFKGSTLRQRGALPRCDLVDVPVDLRQDWPTALQQAGFDASAPSVWTVEGLLWFLPAAAQDLLFERIQALAAAGSRIAVEATAPDFTNPEARERHRAQVQRSRELAARLGREQSEVPDFQELWYFEDRSDVGDWLRGHGWTVSVQTGDEMMARYDRRPQEGSDDSVQRSLFVSGER